ncbi:hypothetical protein [Tenacibaculum singaporense]|uniref:hypothetical protein n=1 Tax=Tenacibaculum singaporense TaxID=2358479 RepID=UPI000F659936|nr:hypothetical protein [Tenacibaculum singaporense]RSC93157.1 hypothetical protein EI424_12030 [Tenacibaculum singaporense]
MPSFKIDKYSVRIWSSRKTNNLNPGVALAGIYLYQGTKYRGYAYFFAEDTPLAQPVYNSSTGQVFVHYNLSQFDAVLDILRNESPIYLYYHSPSNAGLNTSREPVGENE